MQQKYDSRCFLEGEKFISSKVAENVHAIREAHGVDLKWRVFNACWRCI
jgi:hypothetical protein